MRNTAAQLCEVLGVSHKQGVCPECGVRLAPDRKSYCGLKCQRAFHAKGKEEMVALDAEKLRRLFYYDAEHGRIFRKSGPGSATQAAYIDNLGYRRIDIFKRRHFEHRLVWLIHHGEWPKDQIDHINHNRADNRIENLRAVTPMDNSRNRSPSARSRRGALGVSRKKDGRWRATIGSGNQVEHLGIFGTEEEAVAARKAAEQRLGYHPNHGKSSDEVSP